MEEWQGCLSPACQAALQSARNNVTRRGGYAVTLEDFLLAMLDEIPELCGFLQRQGVDLDELTRTIQCEQPIVTAVASENLLSSQLIYWLDCAREISGAAWLQWPVLLKSLVLGAERLREKAYVAVLEIVNHWPRADADQPANHGRESAEVLPVVMADAHWLGLAEDISVLLSASPDALVWVCGERGSGKSSWLRSLITELPGGAIEVDIRREADILASDQAAVPGSRELTSIAPTLVLDNVSPQDLVTMMSSRFSIARELVTSFPGPVLMLGPDSAETEPAIFTLQQSLGRSLERFAMPSTSIGQRLAILTMHQPLIEKRWGIELAPGLVEHVAGCHSPAVVSPGAMLQWVERAAARLSLFAMRGPYESVALEQQTDSIRRQSLLAMARQQPIERLDYSLETLTIARAASEVAWHERKRKGTLRVLNTEDLQFELERRVAAGGGSGHYSADQNQTRGLELA